ncbi:MAG: succinylglutamate desuccinylase/aspartoacylase family protein [Alphaproteobacteria bacterium]|nr:succinylglutamate desuccinylase/aspartoacylase family protein [Alphaproteobacteria bacterium]
MPLPVAGAWRLQAGEPAPDAPHLVVVGRQHGNEWVGERVLDRLREEAPRHLVRGSLTGIVANLDARALDLRHTPDGVDMNRLWSPSRLATMAARSPEARCSEERRVLELAPLVLDGTAILDLHSTSRPSPVFLLFRDDLRHARLAERLGVARLVTGVHERGILEGGLCANAGLEAGEEGPRLGFTLEAGQHDDEENLARAWSVTVRLLHLLGLWDEPPPPLPGLELQVYDMTERICQAPVGTAPYRFVGHVGGEPGGGRAGAPRALASFERVEADEIILRRGAAEQVRAESPFTMVMPAPTAGPGEDLYFVCQERPWDPEARPGTDVDAHAQARAIERMLDVLAADEGQRGVVQVTTTARRTLDACAELLLRTVRLPPGHPDRRLTVIGRGDGGGDERDQRAALRWRYALRRALESGVPVRRHHLLRGTQAHALAGLLDDVVETGGTLELCVAPRQPHTVALVAVGDLRRALETGDVRHVGVALLVEAATPEPDGDDVWVHVHRAGIVGARPALLRAATALVDQLTERHRHAVAELGLDDPSLPRTDDGALRLQGAEAVQRARARLLAWHRARSVEALAAVVTRPVPVPAGSLGSHLARVMRTSGVLDRDLVASLVPHRVADGWEIRPPGAEALASAMERRPGLQVPTPVIEAGQVTADSFERWRGWRRYLGDGQLLPGASGRDIDVGFDGERIQQRIARWLDETCEAAAAEPGRWLVAIAGDGLRPSRELSAGGWEVVRAHQRVVLDPAVCCLRVQHAQGAHLGFVLDLARRVGARPATGAPFTMAWEAEHGGSVSVLLIGRRDGPAAEEGGLDGWRFVRSTVLVSGGAGLGGYDVALSTDGLEDHAASAELVHFARVHVERLLRRATWRVSAPGGLQPRLELTRAAQALVAGQVAGLAAHRARLSSLSPADRPAWVMRTLDLRDPDLAAAVAQAAVDGVDPEEAARRIVQATSPWPGDG